MASTAPKVSFGTAGVSSLAPEVVEGLLGVLEKHNVKELDTAYIYPDSEKVLGEVNAPVKFTISTKAPGFAPGSLNKQSVLDGIDKSLSQLGVKSVDIYYLHAPDPNTPIEETLSAISESYKAGKFARFGISNFRPAEVQKIYDIQSVAGAVLPTVFQGNYNAVSRHIEEDLFPLLRKLKISFYAYSPIGGGFLTKNSVQLRAQDDEGRFGPKSRVGELYIAMYSKDTLFNALDEWGAIAQDAGISKAALAYRWIAYHSALRKEHGDAIIVGASKVAQLEESLGAIEEGPLEAKIAERASAIWETVKDEAPLDNYHSYSAVAGSTK